MPCGSKALKPSPAAFFGYFLGGTRKYRSRQTPALSITRKQTVNAHWVRTVEGSDGSAAGGGVSDLSEWQRPLALCAAGGRYSRA